MFGEAAQFLNDVGVPVGAAAAMFWLFYKHLVDAKAEREKHRDELKTYNDRHETERDRWLRTTEKGQEGIATAIKDLTTAIDRQTEKYTNR